MVRAETEPKTGTLLPFSPSEVAKTGTILKPRDLSNFQPNSTTSGATMVAKANPEIYPDGGKKGREMTKEERESSTYTKEITAVVEDLDLAPKRRSILQSLYQWDIFQALGREARNIEKSAWISNQCHQQQCLIGRDVKGFSKLSGKFFVLLRIADNYRHFIQHVLKKIHNSPFGWGGLLPHRLDHQEVKVR